MQSFFFLSVCADDFRSWGVVFVFFNKQMRVLCLRFHSTVCVYVCYSYLCMRMCWNHKCGRIFLNTGNIIKDNIFFLLKLKNGLLHLNARRGDT